MLRHLLRHVRLAPLLLLPLTTGLSLAGPDPEKQITASAIPLYSEASEHSVVPVRVELNNPTGKDAVIDLTIEDTWNSSNSQIYSFSVPQGKTVNTVIYPYVSKGPWIRWSHDNTTDSLSVSSVSGTGDMAILQTGTPSAWNTVTGITTRLNVMDWPADYRTYAARSVMVMPEQDYSTHLDEPHRKAIRQWVLGGGRLILVGDKGRAISAEPLGRGVILHAPSLKDLSDEAVKGVMKKLHDRIPVNRSYPQMPNSQSYFQSTPSILISVILLAFAVLVGPVSLFVLAPAGKRQRLFILIPSISLGFSLLLAVVILSLDGTGGTGVRNVHIMVNPEDHTGIISQTQVCKTSVLLNNTFTLPENTYLNGSLITRDSRTAEGYEKRPLENTARHGEECSGGWFTSKATVQHRLMRPISTRAAVTVTSSGPDGVPVLQSTFPAALTELTCRTPDGAYWKVDRLPPGSQMAAVPSTPPKTTFSMNDQPLPPGHFQARMDSADGEPGAIPTLESIDWKHTNITVSGPIAGQTQPR